MRSDEALFLDMFLALQRIERFTHGLREDEFLTNELVQSAVIREFQVLGEAARLVSEVIVLFQERQATRSSTYSLRGQTVVSTNHLSRSRRMNGGCK